VTPAVASAAPGRSSAVPPADAAAGSHRGVSDSAATLTSSATANIQRHDTQVVTTPDSSIPDVAPSTDNPPQSRQSAGVLALVGDDRAQHNTYAVLARMRLERPTPNSRPIVGSGTAIRVIVKIKVT
jgi:hypothetical protein